MDSFLIRGGNRLKGKIEISGSKNSALPILAACLMADGQDHAQRRPAPQRHRLDDQAARRAGVPRLPPRRPPSRRRRRPEPQRPARHRPSPTRSKCEARYDIVKTMRASICVLGPLLAKRGKAIVSIPGGCAIGDRPVDLHVRGLQKLGAEFRTEDGNIVGEVPSGRLKGCRMYLGGAQGPTVLGHDQRHAAPRRWPRARRCWSAPPASRKWSTAPTCSTRWARRSRGHGTPEIRIEGVDKLTGCRAPHHPRPHRVRHLHDRRRHHQRRAGAQALQPRSPDRGRGPPRGSRRQDRARERHDLRLLRPPAERRSR